MKLYVRRKIAVPFAVLPTEALPVTRDSKLRDYVFDQLSGVLNAMKEDARRDGLESGDVLVEVLP